MAILAGEQRVRAIAMAIALVSAPLLVLGDVWDEPRVADFRASAAQLGAAVGVAAAGVVALVLAFRRFPHAFAVVAIAVLPLRVPVEIGGETANLLVPLYLVIAAGAITMGARAREAPAAGGADGWGVWLRRLLAATLVLYAIQASYSEDVPNAIENIGFFLVPFAVLFVLLADLQWSAELLRRAVIAVGAVALACSLIAIYQYFARDLFLNPELFDANQLHVYFRVNSVFFDPNILARYLALAMTLIAACIAWGTDRRELGLAAGTTAMALIAIAFSYSITGLAALMAGLGVVAILRWSWRGAAAAAAVGATAAAVLLIAGGTPTSDVETDRAIDSGHYDLVRGGLQLAGVLGEDEDTIGGHGDEDFGRPLAGHGSGSFGAAFYDNIERARTTVSHSEPITVAAEQGAIGFLLYLALVAIALVVVLGGGAGASLARTAIGAAFAVMLISSFGYTGFTTDPATWALLAIGLALRREAEPTRAAVEAPDSDPPEPSTTIQS